MLVLKIPVPGVPCPDFVRLDLWIALYLKKERFMEGSRGSVLKMDILFLPPGHCTCIDCCIPRRI